MIFSNYTKQNELEDVYDTERKQVDQELLKISDLRNQIRKENEKRFDVFLYLKGKMGYSNEARDKMLRSLEEYECEVSQQLRQNEMKLEAYKDELKREYVKQFEKIEGGG